MIQASIPTYPVQISRLPALFAAAGDDAGSGPGKAAASGCPGERLLGKRVLIVEDEALLAMELELAFADEGAEVIGPALSLAKALETVAATAEIDLAVLDVDIAGHKVYPVAEQLRRRGVPFVFHTAHGSRAQLTHLFPGAVTLMKPTLPETLIGHLLRLEKNPPHTP